MAGAGGMAEAKHRSGRLRWRPAVHTVAVSDRRVRRSRFVGMMKWALPIAALAMLAAVAIWPGAVPTTPPVELTFANGGKLSLEPGMVKARYVGVDDKSRPFVVTAERARPAAGDNEIILLDRPQADITLNDGTWLALSALSGSYQRVRRTLDLDGPVNLFSDNGFEFTAETAHVDFATGTVTSDRPVQGQGPLGLLKADRFRASDRGKRLFFTGSVRMTLFPGGRG